MYTPPDNHVYDTSACPRQDLINLRNAIDALLEKGVSFDKASELLQPLLVQIQAKYQASDMTPGIATTGLGDETAAAKAALHQMIDELPFTHDDILFLTVIVTGFWSVPPAALFQQLRGGVSATENTGGTMNTKPAHPFTLQLELPTGLTAVETLQLASAIIANSPDCIITADTKGINGAIAEQLQQQYPHVRLKPL